MYSISDPGLVAGFTSEGLHINDDGDVVGMLKPVGSGGTKAFVWKSSLTVLPSLGFGAEARAINGSGDIAGAAELQPGRLAAVVWNSAGSLTRLAEPPGTVYSFTHGIDDTGRVAGGFVQPGPREVPLLWANLHAPNAAPVVAPVPPNALWSEALGLGGGTPARACGTSINGQARAFVWHTGSGLVVFLQGETAVAVVGNDVLGAADGKPAFWSGGAVAPTTGAATILPGIGGIPTGVANGGTGPDEIVGTVSVPEEPSTSRPFLRRRFRRDEVDPASAALFPRILQLPASETIDLNAVTPPGSGWTLLTAAAINARGQITGTGIIGGQPRAYRLSPPVFESPLKHLPALEFLMLFGGVVAGGGGFGITPSGHIIPIPAPRPDAVTVERVIALVRNILRELEAHADATGRTDALRTVVQGLMEEASRLLNR